MEKVLVSGPVIIVDGRLLVVGDNKDNFYKLPGGTVNPGEDLIAACKREVREEINGDIDILRELSPMNINWSKGKPVDIELHHYLALLKNPGGIHCGNDIEEIRWFYVDRLNQYNIAPNIKFLLERGEIK